MTTRLPKASAVVLLLAMALALAAGLLAWGPIALTLDDPLSADSRPLFGIPNGMTALACLPLCAVSVWGMQNLLHAGWPAALTRPWLAFFACCFVMSATSALYHLAPDNLGWAISNTFAAVACVMLLLGCLAERVAARCGSPVALLAGATLAICAGLWWLTGDTFTGRGDLRGLWLVQALPALLIPAGALSLPGRQTSAGDWFCMLGIFGAARLLEQADAAVLAATHLLGGHAVMHLLLAGGAGLLAYRAATAVPARRGRSALGASVAAAGSQRQTSLNTAG